MRSALTASDRIALANLVVGDEVLVAPRYGKAAKYGRYTVVRFTKTQVIVEGKNLGYERRFIKPNITQDWEEFGQKGSSFLADILVPVNGDRHAELIAQIERTNAEIELIKAARSLVESRGYHGGFVDEEATLEALEAALAAYRKITAN